MRPAWLRFQGTEPISAATKIAVAIQRTERGWHTGILSRDDEADSHEFLHLAFHCDVRAELPTDDLAWVAPTIAPELTSQIAARCRRIRNRYAGGRSGSIPFGLMYVETTFAPTGELQLGGTERGLTCATFVLAVIRSVGVELAEIDSWQPRESDASFLAWVIGVLQTRARPEHVDGVSGERHCARFRPTEVAASTAFRATPMPFELARATGQALDEALPTPPPLHAEYRRDAGPRPIVWLAVAMTWLPADPGRRLEAFAAWSVRFWRGKTPSAALAPRPRDTTK
jgi:hypothetical protein